MKTFCLVFSLVVIACLFNLSFGLMDKSTFGQYSTFGLNGKFLQNLWNKFKKDHNKMYLSEEYEQARFEIFKENVVLIDKHNNEYSMGLHTYTLGVNSLADWTIEEIKERLLNFKANSTHLKGASNFMRLPAEVKLPYSIDWRKKGAVTPVKNQGQCGSCWSFSVTGVLEAAYFRATGKLVSLSEQQMVDCSSSYGNIGCKGGYTTRTFQYVKDNGGVQSESDYPYVANVQQCRFNKANVVATCTGYVQIPSSDEGALAEAVATVGPVSVCIDASKRDFVFYKGGIYVDNTCSNDISNLTHAILAVGYTSDSWIVKNSWGESWGENGYIRIARNSNNMCGIATYASYALV